MYGFSGCSDFHGFFYFVKNNIQFTSFEAGEKDCTNASDGAFLALLSKKRFAYSFEPNGLKLTARDGSAIFFKKVD
ncbi:MAG: META domain-containing protein [Cytophaga sp.]|uniref:META domain-containing protein n=1 Tax=Cytophaga sp. TaxID=29535 RepID=UPI003F7E052B